MCRNALGPLHKDADNGSIVMGAPRPGVVGALRRRGRCSPWRMGGTHNSHRSTARGQRSGSPKGLALSLVGSIQEPMNTGSIPIRGYSIDSAMCQRLFAAGVRAPQLTTRLILWSQRRPRDTPERAMSRSWCVVARPDLCLAHNCSEQSLARQLRSTLTICRTLRGSI